MRRRLDLSWELPADRVFGRATTLVNQPVVAPIMESTVVSADEVLRTIPAPVG